MIPPDVRLAPQPALIARELSRKIAVRPKDPLLYTCRGVTYAKLGEPAKAIHDVSRAITLDPCSATAYDFRGSQYAVQRDFTKAMEDFNRALEIDPRASGVYDDRGLLYVMQGESAKALEDFGRAIDVDPDAFDAYIHRGALYRESGNWQRAADDARRLMLRLPAEPVGYYSLAAALSASGNLAGVYGLGPKSPAALSTALGDLAWVLATHPNAACRNGAEAARCAELALAVGSEKTPAAPPERTPRLLDVLAASYAEAGRFAEAFDIAQQAIERAVADGDQSLADEIRGRLQLYKARKPYRVSPPS